MKHMTGMRWLSIAIAAFDIISGAPMDVLFIIKLKIFAFIKWLYRSPLQLCWPMNREWLSNFEHIVQFLFETFLISYLFLEPHLTTYYLDIGVIIRKITKTRLHQTLYNKVACSIPPTSPLYIYIPPNFNIGHQWH